MNGASSSQFQVGATETTFGREWDKGHFVAHSIGGAVDRAGVSVFVQLRALNRGWSEAGKRFREMEAYWETNLGTFCFNRPDLRRSNRAPGVLRIRFDKGWWRISDGVFCKPVNNTIGFGGIMA